MSIYPFSSQKIFPWTKWRHFPIGDFIEISGLKDTLTSMDTIKLKIAVLKAAALQARMNDLM